jgi:hypothetical protein
MAHIVASSRQGPRGRFPISPAALNSAENLILLCGEHHTIIDTRPRTYTVDVLLEMKRRHEAPFVAEPVHPAPETMVSETLLSSLLVVSELPQRVWAAPCLAAEPRDVSAAVRWPAGDVAVPFICREGRVFAFHDLAAADGPFADAVDRGAVEVLSARDLQATPDGQRWYVELLNRALSWHMRQQGLRFDRDHDRYFFGLRDDGTAPRVRYRSKTGRMMNREVVREAVSRNGRPRGFWWHEAVSLRFLLQPQAAALAVRPEFHLTRDGREPFDGPLVGRRVTRRKSRIYNPQYIDRVQFWREVLTGSRPRVAIHAGGQRLTIQNELLTCEVSWPGVPNDSLALDAGPVQDDLLSLLAQIEQEGDDDYDEVDDDDWDDDGEA